MSIFRFLMRNVVLHSVWQGSGSPPLDALLFDLSKQLNELNNLNGTSPGVMKSSLFADSVPILFYLQEVVERIIFQRLKLFFVAGMCKSSVWSPSSRQTWKRALHWLEYKIQQPTMDAYSARLKPIICRQKGEDMQGKFFQCIVCRHRLNKSK